MKKLKFIFLVLLASLLITFSGCGLVSEAVRQSIANTKIVQAGTTIEGDGFSVRVPASGFYLVRNSPMPGDLCLRSTDDFIGSSYNVYPFTLSAPASSLQAAWQSHMKQHMSREFLNDYRILSQHTNVWQGSVSLFQTGYIPSDFLTANCVMCRGTNYFWIVRSVGLFNDAPDARDISGVEHDLQTFLDGLQFNQQTNN